MCSASGSLLKVRKVNSVPRRGVNREAISTKKGEIVSSAFQRDGTDGVAPPNSMVARFQKSSLIFFTEFFKISIENLCAFYH
jgi:hypothetical protein